MGRNAEKISALKIDANATRAAVPKLGNNVDANNKAVPTIADAVGQVQRDISAIRSERNVTDLFQPGSGYSGT